MPRLEISDSTLQILQKMSEGDIHAQGVLLLLLLRGDRLDPDARRPGLDAILTLDTLAIYGAEIRRLHHSLCGGDIINTMAVLRAVQLGLLDKVLLYDAIENGPELNTTEILAQVRAVLPRFAAAKERNSRMLPSST